MIHVRDIQAILIEPTSHCNLHCPQCDRFTRQGHQRPDMRLDHLDLQRTIANLDLAEMPDLLKIRFEGDHGDPVMHPDIAQAVSALSSVPEVSVVTNGSLRSTDWWRDLARYPNLTVEWAIDGLEDTNHVYRINSQWHRIMRNAQTFIEAGGRAIWKYIVFAHNQHQVSQARQLSQQLGFVDFHTETSNRNFYDNDTWPVWLEGEYQHRDLAMASGVNTRQTTQVIMMQRSRTQPWQPPHCNWLAAGQIYIDYLGHVIPCCMTSGMMWRQDITGQLWRRIVGDAHSINIHDHSLTEILAGEFYQHRLQDSFGDISTVHHACYANCSA